jgi:hypothetical protein
MKRVVRMIDKRVKRVFAVVGDMSKSARGVAFLVGGSAAERERWTGALAEHARVDADAVVDVARTLLANSPSALGGQGADARMEALRLVRRLFFSVDQDMMIMAPGRRTERASEFADALARLRRDGGALLVVGATPDTTHQHACSRMLGSSKQPRVVCRTDRTCTAGADHAGGVDRLVDLAVAARTAAADRGDAEVGPTPDTGGEPERSVAETVPEFGEQATDAVAGAAADASDLRVCVDSLLPLVDAVGAERVFQWYHTVAADVRAARGVCHAHLPVARDDDLVGRLEALVDATVELRLADGTPQQRWFVHGTVTSDWLPLQG